MPIRSQDPREGSGGQPRWDYLKTLPGTEWDGYLWGPPLWLHCHIGPPSLPCLKELTCGHLDCQCDARPVPTQRIGYVPVVRELDGRPGVVIIHECSEPLIIRVPWKTRVVVRRGKAKGDTVSVRPHLGQQRWRSTAAWAQREADLTESLLRMWHEPRLTEWYRACQGVSDGIVDRPGGARGGPDCVPGGGGEGGGVVGEPEGLPSKVVNEALSLRAAHAARGPKSVGEQNGFHKRE